MDGQGKKSHTPDKKTLNADSETAKVDDELNDSTTDILESDGDSGKNSDGLKLTLKLNDL